MASVAGYPTVWVGVSSHGELYEIICCVFLSLACVAVALRVTARFMAFGKLLIDDYLCIAAAIFAMGLIAIAVYFVHKAAMGWHEEYVPIEQLELFFKVFFAAELVYAIATALYKLAVIFLYRQVFAESKTFNILSWIMVGITVAWYISGLFATIFQCVPVDASWNFAVTQKTCIDLEAYVIGFSIANIVIDFIILTMPLPWIWRLNFSSKKKIAISAMFLVGLVVCVASIIRLTVLVPFSVSDATYRYYRVSMWSDIETSIGIIAACLPTLRQFFFRIFGGSKSSQAYTYTYPSNWSSTKEQSHYESAIRPDDDVVLGPMRPDEGYTEVEIKSSTSNSRSHIPDSEHGDVRDTSFLDIDPFTKLTAYPLNGDANSIVVRKDTSIEVYE